jgi:imidazolonepropionase-like amidohydrolase
LLRAGSEKEAAYTEAIAKGQMTAKAYNELLMQHFDTAAALNTYRMLAKNGTAVVPTLSISKSVAYLDQDNHTNDPELKMIGPGLIRTYQWRVDRAAKDDAAGIAYRHQVFERTAGLLPLLKKAGVTIIAGTDAGYLNSFDYPGSGLHKELALMVRYGLTPREALEASVIQGPAFMHQANNYGAVAVGKIADLLLLGSNPLKDISATEQIEAVIVKGAVFDQQELNAMKEDLKRRARQ